MKKCVFSICYVLLNIWYSRSLMIKIQDCTIFFKFILLSLGCIFHHDYILTTRINQKIMLSLKKNNNLPHLLNYFGMIV